MADISKSPLAKWLHKEAKGTRTNDSKGEESKWLAVGKFVLSGKHFLVGDAAYIPSESEGFKLEADAGRYLVEGKAISYPGDTRIARLRVFREQTTPEPGGQLGEVWTDTATIGLCDFEKFTEAVDLKGEKAEEEVQEQWEAIDGVGILSLPLNDDEAVAFCVSSGFGDGTFPLLELLDGQRRVGFEVVFIESGRKYPFSSEQDDEENSSQEIPEGKQNDENPVRAAMNQLFEKLSANLTGNPNQNRAMANGLLAELEATANQEMARALDEMKSHFIINRKATPPSEGLLIPSKETPPVKSPALASRIKSLQQVGFVSIGAYCMAANPQARVLAFFHPTKIVFGSIVVARDNVYLSLDKIFHKGLFFSHTEIPSNGKPHPVWQVQVINPGQQPEVFVERFLKELPDAEGPSFRPEDYAQVQADGYSRFYQWWADRGGWTAEEIKVMKKLGDDEASLERLSMERRDEGDKALWFWLRSQQNLPFNPQEVEEQMVIIHDDLNPEWLGNIWAISTKDFPARRKGFPEGQSRETFAQFNNEHGNKLRLVLQKLNGYRADFYLPAI